MKKQYVRNDFCPVCKNVLRTHTVSRLIACITKKFELIEMGVHEAKSQPRIQKMNYNIYEILGIKNRCLKHDYSNLFTHGKNYFVVKCSNPVCFESVTFFQKRD